jgi:hypothetical protein
VFLFSAAGSGDEQCEDDKRQHVAHARMLRKAIRLYATQIRPDLP